MNLFERKAEFNSAEGNMLSSMIVGVVGSPAI